VEDITAALDDMIEENELLRENAHTNHTEEKRKVSAGVEPPPGVVAGAAANEELDALGRALQGFPAKQPGVPPLKKEYVDIDGVTSCERLNACTGAYFRHVTEGCVLKLTASRYLTSDVMLSCAHTLVMVVLVL